MHRDAPNGPFDLLGLQPPSRPVRVPPGAAPELSVPWGAFRQSLLSSFFILFGGPLAPKRFLPSMYFRDCWIERRTPRRAVAAAALWHVAFFAFPWPNLPVAPRRTSAFEDVRITWTGPIEDLPLVDMAGKKKEPSPRGDPAKPMPPRGADAYHPRQRIFTDPERPTHPRQTLINPAAPPEPPKILPNLPNIVQLGPAGQPARPRIFIDPKVLAKLRPRAQRRAAAQAQAIDAPNLEQKIGEMSLATSTDAPARPKLQINAASAPRAAAQTRRGEGDSGPEIASQFPAGTAGVPGTIIALSATPAPPTPDIKVPDGNLSARISISPEGGQHGAPGGAPNGTPGASGGAAGGSGSSGGSGPAQGGGIGGVGVSISGGEPGKSGISGPGGGKFSPMIPRLALPGHPQPHDDRGNAPERSGPPNFAALPAGAKPETILGPKRIYTLYVNMPNLNSITGSWVLNFSEIRAEDEQGRPAPPADELSGPQPLRKVDPKYPPALIGERIEGEVVLYAVIRRDGSVDSIQLVHGVDERLDANAMEALAHWKFRPASRNGAPVELEAIVHVPFRSIERPY